MTEEKRVLSQREGELQARVQELEDKLEEMRKVSLRAMSELGMNTARMERAQRQVEGLREALEKIRSLAWANLVARGNTIDEVLTISDLAVAALSASIPVGVEVSKDDIAEQLASWSVDAEFRETLKSIVDKLNDGDWVTLIRDNAAPHQPETQAVCPCEVAIDNLDGELCTPCWEACYGRRRHINCTTCSGTLTPEEEEDPRATCSHRDTHKYLGKLVCGVCGTITPEETDNGLQE